ncbi:glutamyl aminopeptidase isoform X2 [Aricia agestis]|uniref:glutamyl aminopeptidase isoform X2 n=1 Tax=Aricia agestis TaxID=91739 RepID=UPI001C20AA26|nr:glutamyl aminopeptidase isoform X2 [Aricia agestis]
MRFPKITLSERLSKAIRPKHYKLTLNPDLTTGLFKGDVVINIDVLSPKTFVALHTKFLGIDDVKFYKGASEMTNFTFFEATTNEQLILQFNDHLEPGAYETHVQFNGNLTRNIVGFYLSHLKNKGTMVASKFQPTYARQAFPCFDEPEFKATYDITLVKPQDYIALSNMNEISKEFDKDTNSDIVTFATSVPMSTYLACFVICNFDYKETEIDTHGIGKNFTLRSFAQKNETHKIDFAQDIGKRATEFYIQYYNVPFPLPKLDMIAIPDYVSGATEHWGLITYRETSFLVDETTASSTNKINVANTIAHELAHMWFGNLVTMKWWDEVWLNEGFASYMQVKALNALEPSWTMLDQFLTKTLHSVLVTDAKVSSHPIVQTVDTPDQITAIFDAISYNKGSSVLRMLEGFIGEDNFRKGVSDYLKKFEFGNTVTQDLLTCLDKYFRSDNSKLNLTYIMDTWTRQMGYPVLNVTKNEDNKYEVTQNHFLLDPDAVMKEKSPFKYRWFVPITYKTSKGVHDNILWFPNTEDSVEITLDKDEEWIKLNNNQVGYYRVNYPLEMWEKLIEQLKSGSSQLTISDRAHLLNDAFALAEASALPYSVPLHLTTYLTAEADYVPWDTAATALNKLANNVRNTSASELLERFIQHIIKPQYDKQSWEASKIGVIEGLSRAKILSLATKYHLPAAEGAVRAMFRRWLDARGSTQPLPVETDLRDFVYYYGMSNASQEEWDKLWNIYLTENDVQELSKLRAALAAPRNIDILKRYLTLAWGEENIRSQDYLTVLSQISANPAGTVLVWDDVRARWPQLVERFTLNSRYLGSLIPSITSGFNTPEQLKEMEEFFAAYPDAGAGESGRRRALETVRNNIRWAAAHTGDVTDWLNTYLDGLKD